MSPLAEKNKARWDRMTIPANKGPLFKAVADRLVFNRPRYEAVAKALKAQGYNIPWEFIAVTHQRESSANFNTYLGNGQPLSKKTTIVPKGRGPFSSWEEGAIDALVSAPPYAAKNTDWSIGGMLEMLEKYNGLGYAAKGLPSPYIWAGTDQYVKGKYTSDGKYDPEHVDTQLGCAGLLKFMGYGKSVAVPVIVTTAAVTASTTTAVSHWEFITQHALSLGISAAVIAAFAGLMIYAYKHKDDVNAKQN